VSAVPGGGPFNAARTIARLGVTTTFVGGLSQDAFGVRISRLLADDGVEVPVAPFPDELTTLALAELDGHGAASYVFYTEGTAAPALRHEHLPAGLVDGIEVLHVGTLGLVLEPMATTIETVVGEVSEQTLVFLDPNCRPATVRDEAAYRARLQRLLARADVVKVSGDDLAYLDPSVPQIQAARALLAYGPRVVLFTDGGSAVNVLTPKDETTLQVPSVEVVDTVGAGDAFGGAFLAFWVGAGLGRDELADLTLLHHTVGRAIVVAGITCTRAGANPPHLDELPG
jgi:fructokinase